MPRVRPRLKCFDPKAIDGKHEWADDIDVKGKPGSYMRLHGFRQCVNCQALVDIPRHKRRLRKWKEKHANR